MASHLSIAPQQPRPPSRGSLEALYYPHLHFNDRAWLRTAALYYDIVTRIVPPGVDPESLDGDSSVSSEDQAIDDDVRELQASGFVRREAPTAESVSTVANEFFDFAVKHLAAPAQRAKLLPAHREEEFYSIHRHSLDPTLLEVLQELKLVHRKAGDRYSDLAIEPVTGGLYMLFLASRMAGIRHLVSDSPSFQALSYRQSYGVEPIRPDYRTFRLASAVLSAAVPVNIESVPLGRILKLRDEFAEDRQRFQDKIQGFAKSLQEPSSEEALRDDIKRHMRALKAEYDVFVDRIKVLNLGVATSLFSVSVPSYVTSTWGFASVSPYVAGAFGALAATAVIVKYVWERESLLTSPYRYLLSVKQSTRPHTMAREIASLNLQDA